MRETISLILQWAALICLCLLFPILWIPVGAVLLVWAAFWAIKIIRYMRSTYYKATKLPYIRLLRDLGKYGEYLTYEKLRSFEKRGARFLFNLYLPKKDGGTSEVDVLMLSAKGLFVFESKNYSGWIFGNEDKKTWCQSLPVWRRGRKSQKEFFYNPIWQNRSHINHLRGLVGDDIVMHSVIVFSERCTLKDITVYCPDINVIKRDRLAEVVNDIWNADRDDVMSPEDISGIYDRLYPYTQVSDEQKAQHIIDINEMLAGENGAEEIKDIKNTAHAMPPVNETADGDKTASAEVGDEQFICPQCGVRLILRTAAKGAHAGQRFYGCSNYPRCRYIKDLK